MSYQGYSLFYYFRIISYFAWIRQFSEYYYVYIDIIKYCASTYWKYCKKLEKSGQELILIFLFFNLNFFWSEKFFGPRKKNAQKLDIFKTENEEEEEEENEKQHRDVKSISFNSYCCWGSSSIHTQWVSGKRIRRGVNFFLIWSYRLHSNNRRHVRGKRIWDRTTPRLSFDDKTIKLDQTKPFQNESERALKRWQLHRRVRNVLDVHRYGFRVIVVVVFSKKKEQRRNARPRVSLLQPIADVRESWEIYARLRRRIKM